jgi:hypothetical protein
MLHWCKWYLYEENACDPDTDFVPASLQVAIHFSYLTWYLIPDILQNGLRQQEHRLVPAIFASFGPTIGLFLFGEYSTSMWIQHGLLILDRLDGTRFNTLDGVGSRYHDLRGELLHFAAVHIQ